MNPQTTPRDQTQGTPRALTEREVAERLGLSVATLRAWRHRGKGPRFLFQRVPEGKTAKNRMHLDLRTGLDAVDRLVGLGATRVREHNDQTGHWVVLLDPEGNEFCVS